MHFWVLEPLSGFVLSSGSRCRLPSPSLWTTTAPPLPWIWGLSSRGATSASLLLAETPELASGRSLFQLWSQHLLQRPHPLCSIYAPHPSSVSDPMESLLGSRNGHFQPSPREHHVDRMRRSIQGRSAGSGMLRTGQQLLALWPYVHPRGVPRPLRLCRRQLPAAATSLHVSGL